MRHTATASTSCAFSAWRAASTEPVSSSPRTAPRQSTLSSTGNLRYRGTSGDGASYLLSRGSSLTPRRISSASRVPWVGEQAGAAAAAGEDRVGGHGGAVDHQVDAGEERLHVRTSLLREFRHAAHDGSGWIHGVGRYLVHSHLANGVTDGEVHEGAADIHADAVCWSRIGHHHLLLRGTPATRNPSHCGNRRKPARHGRGLTGTRSVDGQGL